MPAVPSPSATSSLTDDWLFGWDPTPGIVSVWADRTGRALVWQRTVAGVTCTSARFRPWLWAATLDDLIHLFAQMFRPDGQGGLFDRPLSQIEPLWIQAADDAGSGVGRERG